ncbi:MAG: hypothetical protein HY917_03760 [Candidatus Diapherotrites archaeon]|nr:hypothetical protein [Candidatus Diapherotrites archaeon]
MDEKEMIMKNDDGSGMMEIFMDAEHRLILYYLANKNPRIDEQTLEKETRLSADRIRQILNKLGSEKLVIFEPGHGYTLTEKGLISLYNFHQTAHKAS